MKKIVAALLAITLVGAAITIYVKNRNSGIKFKTAAVTRGPLKATVTATGTLSAVTTVFVGTQVSGTIKNLYADYNSRVRKGQIIAEIDPATVQAQVDQARANLLAARANVEKSKAMFADSRRIRNRNRELFARNLIARSEVDTADANHDSNDAQVQAAVAQVAQAEAALRFNETNLRNTKIISPVDGTVVSRNVEIGQTVAASFQTPTLFTVAQDLAKMQIDTNVDEADIGRIQTGQDVEFTVDAYPDRIFHGTVDQVRIAPITVQNVVTYIVVVKVDNSEMRLKPGMTANVSVVVAGKEGVLKIPNAALRFRPTEKEGANTQVAPVDRTTGPFPGPAGKGGAGQDGKAPSRAVGQRSYAVWILEDGEPKRVPIAIGISDGAFTEVASGDLKEGQEIIVESLTVRQAKGGNGTRRSVPRFIR